MKIVIYEEPTAPELLRFIAVLDDGTKTISGKASESRMLALYRLLSETIRQSDAASLSARLQCINQTITDEDPRVR